MKFLIIFLATIVLILIKFKAWINFRKTYISTLSPFIRYSTLYILVYISLYMLVIYSVDLEDMPTYTMKIIDAFYGFGLSYISGIIIYFFTSHYPQINEKEKMLMSIKETLENLIDSGFFLTNKVEKYFDIQFDDIYPDQLEWRTLNQNLDLNINWESDLRYNIDTLKYDLDLLFHVIKSDKELLGVIYELRSSVLLESFYLFNNSDILKFNNEEILSYISSFLKSHQKLFKYYLKNFGHSPRITLARK